VGYPRKGLWHGFQRAAMGRHQDRNSSSIIPLLSWWRVHLYPRVHSIRNRSRAPLCALSSFRSTLLTGTGLCYTHYGTEDEVTRLQHNGMYITFVETWRNTGSHHHGQRTPPLHTPHAVATRRHHNTVAAIQINMGCSMARKSVTPRSRMPSVEGGRGTEGSAGFGSLLGFGGLGVGALW
jgi:hypothetical protein